MRSIKKGATSQSVYIEVLDSTSTTGGRKTGLAFNTASLTAYYVRNQGSATAITLATLAAANSAWSSGGFKEVDATNMPGVYRLDVPDASVAAGAGDDVTFTLKGATGMAQVSIGVQLLAWDPQDAVRGGLTALPNAAANAAGGLPISIAGALDLDEMNADIEAIEVKTTNLPALPASTTNITTAALGAAERTAIADAMLDETSGVETSWTVRQFFRIIFAALAGKADGMGTATGHFRDQADTKNRITATIDANGNRTAVTLDAS